MKRQTSAGFVWGLFCLVKKTNIFSNFLLLFGDGNGIINLTNVCSEAWYGY